MKPVNFKASVNKRVVTEIKSMLHDAEQGNVQGFAACGVNHRGEVYTVFAGDSMPFLQIGALQTLSTAIQIRESDQIERSLRDTLEL